MPRLVDNTYRVATITNTNPEAPNLNAGNTIDVVCDFGVGAMTENTQENIEFVLVYQKVGGSFAKATQGVVISAVTA